MLRAAIRRWPVGLMCRVQARWTNSSKRELIFKERWNKSGPAAFKMIQNCASDKQPSALRRCLDVLSVKGFIYSSGQKIKQTSGLALKPAPYLLSRSFVIPYSGFKKKALNFHCLEPFENRILRNRAEITAISNSL